jgi:hypothetical protein
MLKALCMIALLALCCTAHAAAYKWTDDDGNVQYSGTPPTDRPYENVKEPPPPPSLSGAETDGGSETPPADGSSEANPDQQRSKIEANCNQARANLEVLNENELVEFTDPDTGETRRLDEEERQAQITQSQKDIDYYCTE